MNSETAIKMSDCMKRVTLKVKITDMKKARLRIKAAVVVIKFAAMIAGCGIKIEEMVQDE